MFNEMDLGKMTESLRNSPDDLYQQFIDTQETFDTEDVSELAQGYECLTQAHLQVLSNLRTKRSLNEDDSKICKKLEVMLREERNTWRLAKALYKDQLLTGSLDISNNSSRPSDIMDEGNGFSNHDIDCVNGDQMIVHQTINDPSCFSEEQLIGNFYLSNGEIRRMQLVTDWLEANEANDLDYKDEEDKVEFYSEGPTAWESTFHAMRAKYNIDISQLDITMNPNAGLELCSAMDPDAPIRTKRSLAHADKEVEIRLFKHLFRFVRAGKLDEGQELAQRVGYYWLSASLDGWLPHSDPNLDDESLGTVAIHQPFEIRPVSGNKKRNIWKKICFESSRISGLSSFEKAILGVLGGNLKSVLPVCDSWSDQLWARLRCSIDIKIERGLKSRIPQENRPTSDDYPQEFYDNYQDIKTIFKSIKDQKLLSPFKEATIHQTVQKFLILNDIDGLLNQLGDWCEKLEYDNNLAENDGAVSPHFLRFFAHVVLFLRDIKLVTAEDVRGTKITEAYISLLTRQKLIESVAHYTTFLPRDNQIVSFARLLATIDDRDERKHCLKIAKESKLEIDEITQTVVEIIMAENNIASESFSSSFNTSHHHHQYSLPPHYGPESNKITASDKRKIDALDYLLYLESKNYVAILHHGNILLRHFAIQKKLEAVKEGMFKLPRDLTECVQNQWRLHTNNEITLSLSNNIRELDGFRCLLEAHDELSQWSDWNLKKPEEPRKPANMSKFCDNVNYEQRLKQYQQDLNLWKNMREIKTNSLTTKIGELFCFPGGWMKDIPASESNGLQPEQRDTENGSSTRVARVEQLRKLRKTFIPQMTTVCFNVLQLTSRYEECLNISHLLANEDLKLYDEFSKIQIRDFLDKISEVTKIIVRKTITEG